MAVRPERRLTWDDYVDFPEGERYELIDGEAHLVSAPSEKHQRLLGELHFQVVTHLKQRGGGRVYFAPFDVVLDPNGDVVQPDLVFIADEDRDVLNEANVWGTPTWIVEVLSSKPERDRELKLQRYEHFGVKEYWIVDPAAERVEIYRLRSGLYAQPTIHAAPDRPSPLVQRGLHIDLTELFSA